MKETYTKKEIIPKLGFLKDVPKYESGIFNFDKFAKQLSNVVTDPKTPTPFVIGLHGEWGSGKTSLIGQVFLNVQEKFYKSEDKRLIWFDAWEYERIDPVAALFQKISIQFDKNTNFKRAVKGLVYTFSDVALRAKTGLSLEQVKKNFDASVKEIPTITEQLEKMLEKRRLVVFVDDLDRCLIENSLRILESIKLFLNARGIIFVIAADMEKLERAWSLRYNQTEEAIQEGKDHVEKIFQLRLTLPPKDLRHLNSYVNELASSLPDTIKDLVVKGCPHNPRKIKRILNLIYFLSKEMPENDFQSYFPLVVIWCIMTSSFSELAKRVKEDPKSLIRMALVAHNTKFDYLKRTRNSFDNILVGKSSLPVADTGISINLATRTAVEALRHIIDTDDLSAYNLLYEIGYFYKLSLMGHAEDDFERELIEWDEKIEKKLSKVIYEAGLIG